MVENPTLETGDTNHDMGVQKISVLDQTNSLQFTNMKPDGFVVDMELLSYHTDKDLNANSRLARSLSRKWSQPQRGGEKNINTSSGKERDTNIVASASPRAASTPEKPMVVTMETTAQPITNPQLHHQITIVTSNTAESKSTARRSSFRRSGSSWTINPRRILFFFATLSSMGTMLLICLTLAMRKNTGDETALNW